MTTTLLFKEKRKRPKFMLSNRFNEVSVCFKGIYYFPLDIKKYKLKDGAVKKGIQAVFNDRGKLRQDTFYKTEEFLKELFDFYNQKVLNP